MATREFPVYVERRADGDQYARHATMEAALSASKSFNDGLATQTEAFILQNGHSVTVEITRMTV